MPFKKPFRICNKITLAMPAPEPAMAATIKEVKNKYELRIRIPDAGKQNYTIAIIDGTLYVYEEQELTPGKKTVFGCFMLPANVQQDKVAAFYRGYGLKIIMPKKPHVDTVIRVPVKKEASPYRK